jgi:hypothetical protein
MKASTPVAVSLVASIALAFGAAAMRNSYPLSPAADAAFLQLLNTAFCS